MNALHIAVMFAVIAFGFFSFLVGGMSSRAKTQKEKGDDPGFSTTIHDLVRMTVGSLVVFAGSVLTVGLLFLTAPDLITVPVGAMADPVGFVIASLFWTAVSSALGFYAGIRVQEGIDKKAPIKTSKPFIPALAALGFVALISRVAATSNMTEQMQPVSDILIWAGSGLMPAVLVLILAAVPVIMIMIGIRFAGGLLSGLMNGLMEIFSFKF